ncbi:SpoIIE family protein phosphatase (plasmid) [Deinococcus sp. KNUC1210]|uniref:SpoIIE family protein phosphatase n=1 Tax=Deinococcus sp. KNUC1210 TaxID=2917691 RepID=UPI001EF09044|nr:SpoIIE family protein phosphatase [Deinococcus sp. KNUC1210]ULH17499.1 SpoIIE family protein phosphatase [Deinococcus sp. KNUC1210]
MRPTVSLQVLEQSGVGEARRTAAELGLLQGLSKARCSDLAIVVTELASNLVKHTSGGGTLLLNSRPGTVEVLTLDRGPGISRMGEVLRDGYSTAGSAGTGLGAVSRLSEDFDVYTAQGAGSVVYARLTEPAGDDLAGLPSSFDTSFDIGAVQTTYPGETVCGDDWTFSAGQTMLKLMVVDGLGHGLSAHEAARAAVAAFPHSSHLRPAETLTHIHQALRSTRGAVGAVAAIDVSAGTVQFAGVGNLSGVVLDAAQRRGLLSHNGTLGQETRTVQTQEVPWTPSSVLVVHTDGLTNRWDVSSAPGLLRRRAAVIAGVLYRDYARERDDATVVVVKAAP